MVCNVGFSLANITISALAVATKCSPGCSVNCKIRWTASSIVTQSIGTDKTEIRLGTNFLASVWKYRSLLPSFIAPKLPIPRYTL